MNSGGAKNLRLAVCPSYHAAVELIGRRWNGVILQALLAGTTRFTELRSGIPGITDTMLTQRLRELEDAGVVFREVANARPVEIRYGLTEVGLELSPILEAIASWSNHWIDARESEAGAEQTGEGRNVG
ncbi:winged helix-turn-helix transcriptional regulator [Lysinimonas soli]|uniref:Winged helix-turn-helix transcriptional regulator n=1 Tax=Lysinimonas soli TaxID=1074233 RepID=A0ABW0NKQ3_9MICO